MKAILFKLFDKDRAFLFLVLTIASAKLIYFNLVFPFFNNVDEASHFDTIIKHSEFFLPKMGDENFSEESAQLIVWNNSPEYFNKKEDYYRLPLSMLPIDSARNQAKREIAHWVTLPNHEIFSSPLYYKVAGMFYRLGEFIGIEGRNLLYWTRLINVPIYLLSLIVAIIFLKNLGIPKDSIQAILLLLAVFPQDVFYSLNSHHFSPLLVMIFLNAAFNIYDKRDFTFNNYLLLGLSCALLMLTRLSDIVVMGVYVPFVIILSVRLYKQGQLNKELPKIISSILLWLIPIGLWSLWNINFVGDLTGTQFKIDLLGWTEKKITDYIDHPFFSFSGFFYFLNENFRTFWRGEFVWGLERISSFWIDSLYITTTYIFLFMAFAGATFIKSNLRHKSFIQVCFFLLVLYLGFEAYLSIKYDFGDCFYPSQELPYFTSGRLFIATLVPFSILYVEGLKFTLHALKLNFDLRYFMLVLCVIILISEIVLTWDINYSDYNWFNQ